MTRRRIGQPETDGRDVVTVCVADGRRVELLELTERSRQSMKIKSLHCEQLKVDYSGRLPINEDAGSHIARRYRAASRQPYIRATRVALPVLSAKQPFDV